MDAGFQDHRGTAAAFTPKVEIASSADVDPTSEVPVDGSGRGRSGTHGCDAYHRDRKKNSRYGDANMPPSQRFLRGILCRYHSTVRKLSEAGTYCTGVLVYEWYW